MDEVDISHLTGEYWIRISGRDLTSNFNRPFDSSIFNVWLE